MFAVLRGVIFAVCLTVMGEVIASTPVGASSETMQLQVVQAASSIPPLDCPSGYRTLDIVGVGQRNVCLQTSPNVRTGQYIEQGRYQMAIGIGLDQRLYHVNVPCSDRGNCLYLPATDTLVLKQLVGSPSRQSLVVYERFLDRLTLRADAHGLPYYHFEPGVPNYMFQSQTGYAWSVGSIGASANGRWLGVELYDRGLGLLDLSTYHMRQISADPYRYHVGYDPWLQLAVNDGGDVVVATGINAGLTIFSGTNHCGDDATDQRMAVALAPLTQRCTTLPLDMPGWPDRFKDGLLPQISKDGQRIWLYALTYPGQLYQVRFGPAGGTTLEYVALGDSFTSGEGETDDLYYLPGTNQPDNKCHVSRRSYPFLLPFTPTLMRSVACSGARIADILGPAQAAQINMVEQSQPQMITIGVGGNDAGLLDKLKACLMPRRCEWAESDKRAAVRDELMAVGQRLTEVYKQLKATAPRAKLHVVGYPQILVPHRACGLLDLLLDESEKQFAFLSLHFLNQVIRAAVGQAGAGVDYVDIESSFGDHALCGDQSPAAMNSFRIGNDIAPVSSFPWLKLLGSETFHPTPAGHLLIAQMIVPQLVMSYPPATDLVTPRDYWDGPSPDRHLIAGDVVPERAAPGQTVTVTYGQLRFQPHSTVQIGLQSDTMSTREAVVDNQGGLSTTITVPGDVSEGFYTVHTHGQSYSGELVDIYETVLITPDDPVTAVDNPTAQASDLTSDQAVATSASVYDRVVNNAAGILGVTTNSLQEIGFKRGTVTLVARSAPPLGLIILTSTLLLALCIVLWRRAQRYGYNRHMPSFRSTVKKFIPTNLFKKVEPFGHLLEAVLMNIIYGFPARRMHIIGVTGTNGKTTTSFLIHTMLVEAGYRVALLSTVAYGIGKDIQPQIQHMTTTQAGVLQRRLRNFKRAGVEWVVVETSSHSLAQHRVWGLPYEIAVMTNITHEHLDYHGTFKNYVEAKRRLFKIAARHGRRFGVANKQDPNGELFARTTPRSVLYGVGEGNLQATDVKQTTAYSTYKAVIEKDKYDIRVNIPGDFNVSNSLAAVAVGRELGLTKAQIEKGIAALKSVEGRMAVVDGGQPFKVLIDFASTPDAFERLFQAVRPMTKGKLVAVFGSAGRRDEAKRAVQGVIAGKYADEVILTEEDDRDVNGYEILDQIAAGAKKAGLKDDKTLYKILNREEAIGFALTRVKNKDDLVVFLGKGHEKTIERADGVYPWNEAEVVRAALGALKQK